MRPQDIGRSIAQKFEDPDLLWVDDKPGEPYQVVPRRLLRRVARFLKDEPQLACNCLTSISGVHQLGEPELIEVVYHLHSIQRRHRLVVKVRLERPLAFPHYYLRVDTLSDIWPAANWMEREVYDMVGVHFVGHPDFRRLLLPHDWQGHPLLKDYKEPKAYRGISTSRQAAVGSNPANPETLSSPPR